MNHFFGQQKRLLKISIFLGGCGLSTAIGFWFLLMPTFEQLRILQQEKIKLTQQQQQQKLAAIRQQKLQQDSTLLSYRYAIPLKALRQPIALTAIYAQIITLAHTHHLQITRLKPQSQQVTAHLQQEEFRLEVSGEEPYLLDFLQLLIHQSWLLEIRKLELAAQNATAIHLQATMTVYYENT